MKVFITGATGFLGARLTARLLDRGIEVHALVRGDAGERAAKELAALHTAGDLFVHRGNVRDIAEFAGALAGCDAVYHLASALSGSAAALFMNNVVYTRPFIDACASQGVRRLVLISSLGVYGSQALRKWSTLDEACPLDPQPHRRDLYTFSKVEQEHVARNACREAGLPLVIVRPGVIYGPGRDCLSSRVGLRVGDTLLRLGGRGPLPYTHVENCAEAVLLAGITPGIEDEAFNVVDDQMPSARQLLRRYRRVVKPIRVLPVPQWSLRPLSSLCERYHVWSKGQLPAVLTPYKSDAMWKPLRYSNAKAKARLGWSPTVSSEAGLKSTLETLAR